MNLTHKCVTQRLIINSLRLSPFVCHSLCDRRFHTSYKYQKKLFSKGNYYEILEINDRHNCTVKDIRNAYLTQSKKFHPDVCKDDANDTLSKENTKKFQMINEAYNVLINDRERQSYDEYLNHRQTNERDSNTDKTDTNDYEKYRNDRNYRNERGDDYYYDDIYRQRMRNHWEEINRRQQQYYRNTYYSKDYYGIKGIQRVENRTVLMFCGVIMIIGMFIHYLHYKYVINFQLNTMMERSKINGEIYELAKSRAKYGEIKRKSTEEEMLEIYENRLNTKRSFGNSIDDLYIKSQTREKSDIK